MKKLTARGILDTGETQANRRGREEAEFAVPQTPLPKPYNQTLPKLALELNTRVFIILNPLGGGGVPLQGEYLGASHYEYLILRLPSIPGLVKKLMPQVRIQVQYHSGGSANKFTTEVLNYSTRPALLLFTSYPDRMSVLETRKHQRVTCALPIGIATPYGDAIAVLRDLSKGGCRLTLEMTGQSSIRRLSIGDRVVLQVPLSALEPPSRCIGIVRSVETAVSLLYVGVAFDESNRVFGDALSAYLELASILE